MGRTEEGAVSVEAVEAAEAVGPIAAVGGCGVAAVDTVTSASRIEGEAAAVTGTALKEETVAGEKGSGSEGAADRVAEAVDAVTGATWTTRNAIMARLFQADLAARGDEMPAFRPPGA